MRLAVAALAVSIILAGCGGGGSGSDSTTAGAQAAIPATTNPNAALTRWLTTAATYKLAGSTSNGIDLTATASVAPGPQVTNSLGTFNTATVTIAMYRGSVLYATNAQTLWLSTGAPVPALYFNSSDGSCFLRSNGSIPATSAVADATGILASGTIYSGCSPTNTPTSAWASSGSALLMWEYRVLDGVPMVCVNTQVTPTGGLNTQEQDCIEITDGAGSIGSRMRITVQSQSLTSPSITLKPA